MLRFEITDADGDPRSFYVTLDELPEPITSVRIDPYSKYKRRLVEAYDKEELANAIRKQGTRKIKEGMREREQTHSRLERLAGLVGLVGAADQVRRNEAGAQ